MANNQINYSSRDFKEIRNDLITYLKFFYPDNWQDFSIASPGMALLDLNAYVSDLLFFELDKRYNEQFIDGLTERNATYKMAKTMGYKVPGIRAAMGIADITVDVPPTSDGPDPNYVPLYRSGVNVAGGGQTFQTLGDTDFSSDFSDEGVANRIIEPIFNNNQDIVKYRITKREKIIAGTTKIYRVEVNQNDAVPFYELVLPEKTITEILSIVVYQNKIVTSTPSSQDFYDDTIRFYEVDELPDDQIFVSDDTQTLDGLKYGYWKDVPNRFKKEFLPDGSCKIVFGGGTGNNKSFQNFFNSVMIGEEPNFDNLLDNNALGEKILPNSTIFIKYIYGGGSSTNIGANTLQSVSNISASMSGIDPKIIQTVIQSTRANNPVPAMGGADLQSIEEIKAYIPSSFSSQKRCITINDYISRSFQMGGQFGSIFKMQGKLEDNKIKLYVLSKDGNGRLNLASSTFVKNNLVRYLEKFRMLNDFVEINDGSFINLQVEIDLYINKIYNSNEVKINAITATSNFFNLNNWQMNQPIFISQLYDIIREIPGVINVVDIRFYNMVGGKLYSESISDQATLNATDIPNTGVKRIQIEYIDNAIYSTPLSMFEIRYPEKDIMVRIS